MKKILLIALLVCAPLLAQRGTYAVTRTSSLSTSTEKITVQLPSAATGRSIRFLGASVYCSADCTITIARDGTAATSTALTPVAVSSTDAAIQATAYRSSNVGTGTTLSVNVIKAGNTMVFDLSNVSLMPGKNLSFGTDSITATVIVNVEWREY